MKSWLYLINNFAHDLFTGIWCGSFLGLSLCHSRITGLRQPPAELVAFANDLQTLFFRLGVLSLALVMLTGLIRFLYRRDWDKMENPGQLKKPILIVKHAVLGSAFLIGSVYSVLWTFSP